MMAGAQTHVSQARAKTRSFLPRGEASTILASPRWPFRPTKSERVVCFTNHSVPGIVLGARQSSGQAQLRKRWREGRGRDLGKPRKREWEGDR